ncbi:hypothetical protein [Inquilinus limosus]|uniref:Uncharacterized protein n=1 Tax=Inquilinus limosus MP06 TaxID=1398085 RepID=A0A0A0DBT0_9PROT|nr:hypothetical protein [Inquilinus limosus]KGM36171.1 hypothetical protein P409_00555 [Inquilinus limosus MP06]
MSNVLTFPAQDQPAVEHVSQDQWGRPMYRFAISYDHLPNRTWTADIWAYNQADAEARLEAIRNNGVIAGQALEEGAW